MVKGRWTDRGRDRWMEKVTYRWKMLHIEVGAPPEKRLDVSIFFKTFNCVTPTQDFISTNFMCCKRHEFRQNHHMSTMFLWSAEIQMDKISKIFS